MDDSTSQDSVAALKHTDYNIRCEAARALGKSKDKRAVEPLISALQDSNEFVRMDAAWALGHIGDSRALEPLLHALGDPHGFVRREAVLALGELGDFRAVDRLIAMVEGNQGAAAAKALFKITGEAYERILMSGRMPDIVYKEAIERRLEGEESELWRARKGKKTIGKKCGLCGEIVESGLLACPKCGGGVFEAEKLHMDSQEGKQTPVYKTEAKRSWLDKLLGRRPMDPTLEKLELIAELLSIGQTKRSKSSPRGFLYFDDDGKWIRDPRTREIGERLNHIGGLEMMKDANRAVLEQLGAVPARELDVAWDGIGGWMG